MAHRDGCRSHRTPAWRANRSQNLFEFFRTRTIEEYAEVATAQRKQTVAVRFHPHAQERLAERGATEQELVAAITDGEKFPARFGRMGFRRNFPFDGEWRGKYYRTKQVEAYAVREGDDWLVLTAITRYF